MAAGGQNGCWVANHSRRGHSQCPCDLTGLYGCRKKYDLVNMATENGQTSAKRVNTSSECSNQLSSSISTSSSLENCLYPSIPLILWTIISCLMRRDYTVRGSV